MCEILARVSAEIPLAICARKTHIPLMKTVHDIIAEMGGTRKAARLLSVPPSTVQSWKAKGRIPAERILEIEAVSGIDRSCLRPDLFGTEQKVNEGIAA